MTQDQIAVSKTVTGAARARFTTVVSIDNLDAAGQATPELLARRDALIWEFLHGVEEAELVDCPSCGKLAPDRRVCSGCRAPLACERCHVAGETNFFSCLECREALCEECEVARLVADPNWQGVHYQAHIRERNLMNALRYQRARRGDALNIGFFLALLAGAACIGYIFSR